MKLSIEKWARIKRTDNVYAKMTKIMHTAREMNHAGLRIKAIQWLFKICSDMTLDTAYSVVCIWEEN